MKKTLITIDSFFWPFEFLSNFYESPINFGGVYPTVEHAFQAHKTHDTFLRTQIAEAKTPGIAKQIGRTVDLRNDWEDVKESIMRQLLVVKFTDRELAMMLNTTGDATLIEGNTWHDQYWGNCTCPRHQNDPGKNCLGELLMDVRHQNRTTQQGAQ